MLRLALLLLLLLLLLLGGLGSRPAEAHTPPPVYFTFQVEDEVTTVHVLAQVGLVRDWFGVELRRLPQAGEIEEGVRRKIGEKLAGWLRVRADGMPIRTRLSSATIEGFEDHGFRWRYAHFELRFPTAQAPQQVVFAWTRYEADTNYLFDKIEVELEAGDETSYFALTEQEPEYVWHRPRAVAKPAPVVLPPRVRPPHFGVPAASLGALLLGVLLYLLGRRRGRPRGALLVAGVLLAALLWPAARVDVTLPWGDVAARPPEAEALDIFRALHGSVYKAVGGDTEEEVYDDLAACVTGELLPTLYLDIHESMILKNDGGAVAKIRKTEVLEAALRPTGEAEDAWFEVEARWRVEGKVGHWGHTHQRINEYRANVTVVAVEGRWKIAAIEVLEESRVDDGEKAGDAEGK